MSLSKEELQKVVAVGFLTDGNIYYRKFNNTYSLTFYSCDQNMHDYFQRIVHLAFDEKRSAYMKRKKIDLWTTDYSRGVKNPMIKTLLDFSSTYCTTKRYNPSLNFLLNERDEVKIQAIRFAMSCDGSVSIKRSKSGARGFALRLACAHPKLVLEFQKIFRDIGINTHIDRDKYIWSGIHGLCTGAKDSFRRFAEIGGFLPENVKVTNGRYIGYEKNEVLSKILAEFG